MRDGYSTERTARAKSLFQIKASKNVGSTAREQCRWTEMGQGKTKR